MTKQIADTGISKHQFQLQKEKLEGLQRTQQVKQLEIAVDTEKEKTQQSLQRLNAEKQRTLSAKEDVNIERLKLQSRRVDVTLQQHQINRKNLDSTHQEKENALYGKTLDLKYEGLATDFESAQEMLAQRREQLKQQGILGG